MTFWSAHLLLARSAPAGGGMARCRPLLGWRRHVCTRCARRRAPACIQVICQQLNALGCVLASEPTCASIAAACCVAIHGPRACGLPDATIQGFYEGVKTRLKQLYKAEPMVFMVRLPATPAALVKEHRDFALSLYSREDPPVSCPLNAQAMQFVQ